MSKLKKIISISIIVILATAVVIILIFTRKDNDNQESKTTEPSGYTSMEGGEEITRDDIEARQKMDDFARNEVLTYLKGQYPNHQTILIKGDEWYFTDENTSDNILVRAEVVDNTGNRTEELNVVEIIRENDNLVTKQIYKPDSRYSQ